MDEPARPTKSRDLSFPSDPAKLKEPGAPKPAPAEPPKGSSPEEAEARWREMMDAVSEQPRNPDVLVKAGQLSEQMGRRLEAYTYYHKAFEIDASKTFLVAKLRQYAGTPREVEETTRLSKRPATFARALDDVFSYPLRGSGLGILILGAIFVFGCRLLMQYNIIPLVGTAVVVISTAFLMMFYADVCGSTANGSEDLPEWPDPTRFTGFVVDLAKFGIAGIVAFLPVILLCILLIPALLAAAPAGGDFGEDWSPGNRVVPMPPGVRPANDDEGGGAYLADPVVAHAPAGPKAAIGVVLAFLAGCLVFGIVGLMYWPMAILANVIFGNPFACINPVFILRSIRAAPKNYAICLLGFFGTAVLAGILETVSLLFGFFLFSGLVVTLIEIYAFTVQMRILGVFYRMNQSKLAWMAE